MNLGKWIIGAALVTALAACSGGSTDTTNSPAAIAPTELMQAQAAATPTEAMAAPPVATEPAAPAGATADGDAIPVGSSALHASDPTTASLSGEKPRLVEFFAFW
jgi:uncharacterized lipoprotein